VTDGPRGNHEAPEGGGKPFRPSVDVKSLLEHTPRRSALRPATRRGRDGAGDTRVAPHKSTRQLLAAQDEERRRIARELHDGTASTLVALSLDLTRLVECLSPGDPRELAAACASLCEQSLRELRALAFVLHPPLLEREGLAVALQWLAEGFSKRSGIRVTFEPGTATGRRLRPSVELTLYRIVQEALTNVLRHSGSRTARVALITSAAEVRLTVSDEGGPGRDGARRAGVGIASMRERVQGMGGRLKLAFRQSGTVVTAIVPRA
jgi:two-component system, NarL family, sensor kinase